MNYFRLFVLCHTILFVSTQSDFISSTARANATSHTVIGDTDSTATSSSIINDEDILQFVDEDMNEISSQFIDDIFPNNVQHYDSFAFVDPQTKIFVGEQCVNSKWTTTKKQAIDLAVSNKGDFFIIDINGNLLKYDFISNLYFAISKPFINYKRVSVSSNGTPFVVSSSGDILFNDCRGNWKRLPGCALDIGVGDGGEIFKIGCEEKKNGFSVHKLICSENFKNSLFNCKRRDNFKCEECSNEYIEEKECNWFKIDGAGIRIAVSGEGHPVVVNLNGEILEYDGVNWLSRISGSNARDIDIGREGEIYFTSSKLELFKYSKKYKELVQICGNAHSVAIGPYNHPFIIGDNYLAFASSKQCYN